MINENRLHHILSVARLMKENASKLGLNEEEMFTLGLMHDIGYEFNEGIDHNQTGGNMLKAQNYKYYNEVFYHGVINPPYKSLELDLLNFCDMRVDGKGNVVSFEDRLEDIKTRRGENSFAVQKCTEMINLLKNNPALKDLN